MDYNDEYNAYDNKIIIKYIKSNIPRDKTILNELSTAVNRFCKNMIQIKEETLINLYFTIYGKKIEKVTYKIKKELLINILNFSKVLDEKLDSLKK